MSWKKWYELYVLIWSYSYLKPIANQPRMNGCALLLSEDYVWNDKYQIALTQVDQT